ncbi:MAG: isoprenylcysteine carboxylmethyltransferase family protein [Pirellulales bacterium]
MTSANTLTPRRELLSQFLADFRVPLSVAIFTILMVFELLDGRLQPALVAEWLAHPALGAVLVVVGIAWRGWAAGTLRKGRALATLGPYSLCRHPLYFGSALMMLGFCQLTCSPWHYGPVILLLAIVYGNTIIREERLLRVKYAAAWPAFRDSTPCLAPYMPFRFVRGEWSLTQWLKNHEYRACFTGLASLAAVALLRWLEYTRFFGV